MTGGGTQVLMSCRVLVIEDEYFLANDLEQALRASGAEVIGPTGDLQEALRLVRRDGFDVAVIDINLRDDSAIVLADELMRQNVPFVFATGYGRDAIPQRFSHVTLCEKPFNDRDIIASILGY